MMLTLSRKLEDLMRVKLVPETAFIGIKFAYVFFVKKLSLNAIMIIWFFIFKTNILRFQLKD